MGGKKFEYRSLVTFSWAGSGAENTKKDKVTKNKTPNLRQFFLIINPPPSIKFISDSVSPDENFPPNDEYLVKSHR
jgi:hypothetical protein